MNKQFLAIIIIVIGALFGVLALTSKDKNTNTDSGGSSSSIQASEHIYNPGDHKVTLLEYGDFQCPACKAYFPIVEQIRQDYKDKVTFQFRHFPLNQIHPNAFIGSRAAEAAGKQGKFFEMHDLLYENQDSWTKASDPSSLLEGYAQQLGLNSDQFKKDMMSSETSGIINADVKAGQTLGVNSTPSFAINGKKIEENPRSVDDFKKLIDDELKKN